MAAHPTNPRISIAFQSPYHTPPLQVPRTSGATMVRAAQRGRWTPPLSRSAITVVRLATKGRICTALSRPRARARPPHEESPDGPAQIGAVQDPDPDEDIGPGEGQSEEDDGGKAAQQHAREHQPKRTTLRRRESRTTRSIAQNRAGISAATRVCGQFVHTSMKPPVTKTNPASQEPALPTRAGAGRGTSRRWRRALDQLDEGRRQPERHHEVGPGHRADDPWLGRLANGGHPPRTAPRSELLPAAGPLDLRDTWQVVVEGVGAARDRARVVATGHGLERQLGSSVFTSSRTP